MEIFNMNSEEVNSENVNNEEVGNENTNSENVNPECVEENECFNVDNKMLLYGGIGVGITGIVVYLVSKWSKKRKSKLENEEKSEVKTKSPEASKKPDAKCSTESCDNDILSDGLCGKCFSESALKSKMSMQNEIAETIIESFKSEDDMINKISAAFTSTDRLDSMERSINELADSLSKYIKSNSDSVSSVVELVDKALSKVESEEQKIVKLNEQIKRLDEKIKCLSTPLKNTNSKK